MKRTRTEKGATGPAALSKLLFEAREICDMYHDVCHEPVDGWCARVRDGIDHYRAERGWSPHGFGFEEESTPAADEELP